MRRRRGRRAPRPARAGTSAGTGARAALLAVALLLAPAAAEAGAWLRGPGHAYVKLAINRLGATETIDGAGRRLRMADGGRFDESSLSLYAETGITAGLDLLLAVAFRELAFADRAGADLGTAGLGDLWLRLRGGGFEAGPLWLALLAGVKLPTGYARGAAPPLGTGAADFEVGGAASAALPSWSAYVTGEAAYRARGDYADEIPILLEGGAGRGRLAARLTLAGVESRGHRVALDGLPLELRNRAEDYWKLGPGVTISLDPGVDLDAAAVWVVAGSNTIRSRELGLALVLRR